MFFVTVFLFSMFSPALSAQPYPRKRPLVPLEPSDAVLCIYDSTEGTSESHNPLASVIVPSIQSLGFNVRWHDVASGGLPTADELRGIRAIVTGFLDGEMAGAKKYCAFVKETVNHGIRFVIVGNFGAWKEKDGDFLPFADVNIAFEALGVRYGARWTSDPALFSVKLKDPRIGPASGLTPEAIRHFYHFEPTRPDVEVLIEARRRDADSSVSAPVFVSAKGAMVLQRYLAASDFLEDKSAFHFNVDAFLRLALAYRPYEKGSVLLIYDPGSAASAAIVENLASAAGYAGLNIVGVTVKDVLRLRPADLEAHSGVIVAFEQTPSLITQYVRDLVTGHVIAGGRAGLVLPWLDLGIGETFGAQKAEGLVKARGLAMHRGAFPGVEGLRAGTLGVSWSTRPVTLHTACEVLAQSEEPPVPLWWRCKKGRGELVALNAYEFSDRAFLGFLVQFLLDLASPWAMPVLAVAVEFVDDCPLPMSGNKIEHIGKSDVEFYSEDFYEMILEARQRFGIRPTFLAVFSYEEEQRGPFPRPFAGSTEQSAMALAHRIVADDFPVGLHGMNHLSPSLRGGVSRPFPDTESLEVWAKAGREAFTAVFGRENVPIIFVPPNNFIDEAGKRAILMAMPELKVISSVFAGSENETAQDFAMDPQLWGVVNLPRTWAGHVLKGEAMLQMLNGLLAYGVSTHFVHPDDILDPERSYGIGWYELRQGFLEGVEEVRKRFSFLRERTAFEAALELIRLISAEVRVEVLSESSLRAFRSAGQAAETMILARLPVGCTPQVTGGVVMVSDEASGRHFIQMTSRVLEVQCRR